MNKFIFCCAFALLYACTFQAQHPKFGSARVAFYNVENLFDTLDHPVHVDEDFTPTGKQKWTTQRYAAKLDNIARVIKELAFPALMGLCEVENEKVLQDLIQRDVLAAKKYDFVHYESPDFRGIDVALLYNKKAFKVKSSERIRINFPPNIVQDYTTRDVLLVKGIYRKKHPLYLFINHWPSRVGGLQKSEPKRTYVAQQVRKKVDSLFALDTNANIILMGDFNDETDNKSVARTLGATTNKKDLQAEKLYNCFAPLDQQRMGSYNYRGTLNMLDQIIVSSSLM
ncbi:MAG: hypothetical protein AAGI49_12840, partial [Bacteroidota bacterium]